ncbi:MAG: AAA family ATPase, partial [Mycobacterium sp.]
IGNGVGQLGGGWGDVRGANGVIMAEPSVHADGGCYEWDYGQDERGNFLDPQVLPVPTLPIALDELLPDATPASDAASDATVAAFMDEHTDNRRPELLRGKLNQFATKTAAGESRHNTMVAIFAGAMEEARAGFYPAGDARHELRDVFVAAVTADGSRTRREALYEFYGVVSWGVGQALAADVEQIETAVAERMPRDDAAGFAGLVGKVVKAQDATSDFPTFPTFTTDLEVVDGAWLDSQQFDPVEYTVPGLVSEGLGIIVGPPKAGKSWLVADLALAVASGGKALGALPVGNRPVLYLALEDGHRRLQSRFRRIMGDGQPIPPGISVVIKANPQRAVELIEQFVQEHASARPFVILDTLGKVKPPRRAGDDAYAVDYRLGGELKSLADDVPGSALLVVHHTRKAETADFVDSVSGTNGIAGAADFVAALKRPRHSNEATLSVTGRDIEEAEYALTTSQGLWQLEGGDLAGAAAAAENKRAASSLGGTNVDILAVVAASPKPISPAEVAQKMGIDNVTAGKYLGRLAEGGYVTKAGRGRYFTGDPPCEVCGEPMAAGQVGAHLSCSTGAAA